VSSPSPRVRGEGRGEGPLGWDKPRDEDLQRRCANLSAQNRGEAPSPSGLRFSRPLPAQRGEVKRRRADKQNRSRDTLPRPSFAHHHDAISKIDRPRQTHDPEKWCPVFGQDHAQKMKEAKRRKAHANHCRATSTNVAARRCLGAAARHIGARPPSGASPRHSPPAITPMAQPQNRVSSRRGVQVFCPFAADALS
jgi:hypothetical protein